ncbi:MAG: hypothetical protein M1827_006816 [Pycnora praestabilis]|nr:MAG: hypothetical protein M1827_006816 [Pycnora praestabilis]
MALSLPASRAASLSMTPGPASPTLNFGEDLSRFPSESLHSFSFAHQSEDFIHNRQNVLKRSIDFMRDRLGWAASNPGIASAQAKISGDQEIQSMMDLLARANLMGQEVGKTHGLGRVRGPMTGPADIDGENIFEKSFMPYSESPENLEKTQSVIQIAGRDDEVASRVELAGEGRTVVKEVNQILSPVTTARTSPISRKDTPATARTSPTSIKRINLKRTYTDISPLSLQTKLTEALAQPYVTGDNGSSSHLLSFPSTTPLGQSLTPTPGPIQPGAVVHGHASRWAPAAQAIFTTEANAPWTISSANDLACLVFGVTNAEVRKLGIMEVVREERRGWLEEKLRSPGSQAVVRSKAAYSQSQRTSPNVTTSVAIGLGVTAQLLSKPSSRQLANRRAQTDDGSGTSFVEKKIPKGGSNHAANKSRGVLLCGDVVPIQKRNGATGAASLWVKEKRGGLIWVLEEIMEDVASINIDGEGYVTSATGAVESIWGEVKSKVGSDIGRLIPQIPRTGGSRTGPVDFPQIAELRQFTARNISGISIPLTLEQISMQQGVRVSSFPHIAGIVVLSSSTLEIISSNSVFCAALFGQQQANGLPITDIIPSFDRVLRILTEEDKIRLVDGIVIPEHSFRRARALLALREGKADAAAIFLRPTGLPGKHRDGSEIKVDIQMRVVKSDSFIRDTTETVVEETNGNEVSAKNGESGVALTEVVYALWITYSRHLHAAGQVVAPLSPLISRATTPPHQPSPGQPTGDVSPAEMDSDDAKTEGPQLLALVKNIREAASESLSGLAKDTVQPSQTKTESPSLAVQQPAKKKTIGDFVILEEMGQGAYGQVKLARYRKNSAKKMVLKYVTKRRILVDTWTRDRRLGTVPLEIHVLDYLRRDGLRHPNIVEMADFFEDDENYYIEMVPHGLPGMDLFDYIELRVNMEESECKSIFVQVAKALHHLHTKALVVHRDIKDENVVLDGEGKIKLIDFGSAAYIKNGPFDVFVGTIDYAAPEVLAGQPYRGKEQDVWALGILLYTIVYKENPFYNIDEITDHDLRVPYIMSEESIDLIRSMLNRDVDQRITISQVLEHSWCSTDIGPYRNEVK